MVSQEREKGKEREKSLRVMVEKKKTVAAARRH